MNVKRIMRSGIFRKNSLADQPTGSRVHALGDRPTRDWIRMVTGLAVSALLGSVAMTYPQPLDAASPDVRKSDVRMSRISGDPAKPRRHFRLREPAVLDPVRASELYTLVEEVLQRGYTRSGNAVAKSYRDWRRYNRAPYLSTTHGNHHLSNYANPVAEAYGRFENAGTLPQGSILAKDSFFRHYRGLDLCWGRCLSWKKWPQDSILPAATGNTLWSCLTARFEGRRGTEWRAGSVLHWVPPKRRTTRPPVFCAT